MASDSSDESDDLEGLVLPILRGAENYSDWKPRMTDYQMGKGLSEHLKPIAVAVSNESSNSKKRRIREARTETRLLCSMTTALKPRIQYAGTAYEYWERIRDHCSLARPVLVGQKLREFDTLRNGAQQTFDEFVDRFDRAFYALKERGFELLQRETDVDLYS